MAFTDTSREPHWPQVDRRASQERRKEPLAFGSPQWLAYAKSHNLMPAKDRRKQNRRGPDTRQSLQRLTELQHYASYANELSPELFSREEIILIRTVLSGGSK